MTRRGIDVRRRLDNASDLKLIAAREIRERVMIRHNGRSLLGCQCSTNIVVKIVQPLYVSGRVARVTRRIRGIKLLQSPRNVGHGVGREQRIQPKMRIPMAMVMAMMGVVVVGSDSPLAQAGRGFDQARGSALQ